ncbi:PREDICTED: programmed cell death protein 2 [Dinoponera quadriceps]|uniref:Programmed cell death protein 2 n=1 Tax=Dinoponera quadriceps TaxID=609295 RepID=A0A6P3X8H3_DINQU|nr:PREDICTED: programmed cell death protein 2 [Dinoponera quadriceps]
MVDLGFISECEPWRLESRFFPSKIGGKPAWLDLKNLPGKNDLECDYCGDSCVFLCQIYAPREDPDTFHRTIYVFICKNVECCKSNKNGNLKVFRSQLNQSNIFYSSKPPIEEKDRVTHVDVSQWAKTCHVCGIFAPCHCSKCKVVNYCSRTHQVHDWKNGHKETCGTEADSINEKLYKNNSILFPEYEITIDPEEELDSEDVESEKKELEKYNTMVQDGTAGTLQHEDVDDDLSQLASNEKDQIFAEFRTKVQKDPDQILRYNKGGEVLYISPHNQITDVPKCPECNGNRQFEFQIMPQLLYYLGSTDFKCLDWGILAVFTCEQSCKPNNKYVREYIWKQDIVQLESEVKHDT